jgi:hypothetical protein
MAKSKPDRDEIVSAEFLAAKLGLRPTVVSRLGGDGILVRAERGKYRLWPSVKGYVESLRSAATGRDSPGAKARAKLAEIQLKRAESALVREDAEKYVRVDEVKSLFEGALKSVSRDVMRIPEILRNTFPDFDPLQAETVDVKLREILSDATDNLIRFADEQKNEELKDAAGKH